MLEDHHSEQRAAESRPNPVTVNHGQEEIDVRPT